MTIEANIICDSINPDGNRLTTFVLKYPRFVHSEFMTHRMLSRNASSSRAIPVKKIIQQVIDDPAMPVHWGAEQKGMQSGDELDDESKSIAISEWLRARDHAVQHAYQLMQYGVHKSLVNRVLEPWHHIVVVCSATEWANFFSLRAHKDAQPEFRVLAELMADKYRSQVPDELNWGKWHLPFISPEEHVTLDIETLVKCSTARCARVSYLTHDGQNPSIEKDIELHDRLVVQKPAHASPAEHPAMAEQNAGCWMRLNVGQANYNGFTQYRKELRHENVTTFPWVSRIDKVEVDPKDFPEYPRAFHCVICGREYASHPLSKVFGHLNELCDGELVKSTSILREV